MPIKAILAPIQGIEHDIHALRGAMRLAQTHDAHVTALFVHPTEEDFAVTWARYGMVMPPVGLLAEIDHDTKKRKLAAGTLVGQAAHEFGAPIVSAGQEGVPPFSVSLRIEEGMFSKVAATMAAFHDVVVYGHEPAGVDVQPLDASLLEATLLVARRPAFLAPKLARDTFPSQIVIAWNGSIEGAQAVTSSLPFLLQADNVYAVRVGESDYTGAHDPMLIEYLRRHDVAAEVRVVEAGQHSTGTALLSAVTDLQADLLVMGGYTHGPTRQRMFGGVTRHVLKHAPVPVLMVH
jgi:nucleotide-binding universal stress UspA family protein